ncbi:hypothetical protein ENSA7_48020 [Enhygromyxa salina]|uniref:Uncharacterized protein n=1 Tax=Enhygromyxa salina TaxID=215803 RepID=A0A2S9YIX0_9BACT|nr:hypothetical protein ENSA7_48020 [Enhygromyxa salina]
MDASALSLALEHGGVDCERRDAQRRRDAAADEQGGADSAWVDVVVELGEADQQRARADRRGAADQGGDPGEAEWAES